MSKTDVYVASNPKKELLVGLTKFTLDVELLRLAVEEPAGRWDRIVYVEEFWTIGEAFARRKSLIRMGKKRLGAKISKANPARKTVTPVVPTLSFIAPWTDKGEPPGSCGVPSPLLPPDRPLVGRYAEPLPQSFYDYEEGAALSAQADECSRGMHRAAVAEGQPPDHKEKVEGPGCPT